MQFIVLIMSLLYICNSVTLLSFSVEQMIFSLRFVMILNYLGKRISFLCKCNSSGYYFLLLKSVLIFLNSALKYIF